MIGSGNGLANVLGRGYRRGENSRTWGGKCPMMMRMGSTALTIIIFGRTNVQYQSETLGSGKAKFRLINDVHAKVLCGL